MNEKSVFATLVSGALVSILAVSTAFAGGGGSANAGGSTVSSVAGKVRFTGELPKAGHINMSSDPSCSKQHAGGITSEDFVVGSNSTLGNVVVFISAGLGNRTFDVPTEPVVVQQKGCMYEPHVVGVRANQKVAVVNSDSTTHNIHPVPSNNREWNKAEPAGTTFEETFAREEIAIPIKCNVHPWMRSYIAVFKHPYFSVTGKDGSFDLSNLPPGEYTVEAWHEKLGTVTQKITLAAGENKSLDLVFKASGH
jgi:plastocyanin